MQFESIYFSDSKELYIMWDGLYVRKAKKEFITIDLKNNRSIDSSKHKFKYNGYKDITEKFKGINGEDLEQRQIVLNVNFYDEFIVREGKEAYLKRNNYDPSMQFGSIDTGLAYNGENRQYGTTFGYRRDGEGYINSDINVIMPKGEKIPYILKIELNVPDLIGEYVRLKVE